MSGGLEVLQLKEEDVVKILAASAHLGSTNIDYKMKPYVYKKKQDGVLHHQHKKDLGEDHVGSSNHCCY